MSMLEARPQERRQLAPTTPWIFWRDAPAGGGREGFACLAYACADPDCPCTQVTLQGVMVDQRLLRITAAGDRLDCEYRDGDQAGGAPQPVAVHVDFETGEVMAEAEDGDRSTELASWLGEQTDGEVLDGLYAQWWSARGYEPEAAAAAAIEEYEEGDLVGYGEAFPEARNDSVMLRGERFLLDDMHCIDPLCPCTEVRVLVAHEPVAPTDGTPREASFEGSLLLELPQLLPKEVEIRPGGILSQDDVRELWQRFCRRNQQAAARLEARRQRMKTVRPNRPQPITRGEKVGRNDPCPCGSGQKYKKCCLGKASEA